MFFNRKPKNRRFERKHVLQVKLRSSQRRQLRLRRAVMLILVPGFLVFGAYVAWKGGDALLSRLVYENPAFAIHQVDTQTDGVLSLEQIRRWAGVKLDDNLLALDLSRVRRDLEVIPNIKSAAIERVLPHTLRIRISEREPIAQFVFPQPRSTNLWEKAVYLLAVDGMVMLPLEPHQKAVPNAAPETLPCFISVPPNDLRPGRRVESPQTIAALHLVEAFSRSSMAGLVDLKHVDLSVPNVLNVGTAQHSELLFGFNDLDGQLRRWRVVQEYGQRSGKYVAWMDLSVANNVPARWLDPSLPAPPAPKPLKAVKKKHV
jgi:POTRA domain-containing FtsQ-type protein